MKFCKNVVLGEYIKCDVFRWFRDIKWGKVYGRIGNGKLGRDSVPNLGSLGLVSPWEPPGPRSPYCWGHWGWVMSPPTSRELPPASSPHPWALPVARFTDSRSQLYYVWGWEAPGWVVSPPTHRSKFSYGQPPTLGLILSLKVKRNGFPLIFYV